MSMHHTNARLFRFYEWLLFFSWLLFSWVAIPIWITLIPLGMCDEHLRESRVRRLYRRRLLDWNRHKETILHRGTLIVEWDVVGFVGRLWWLPNDVRAQYPDCPLTSASVLAPSFDVKKRFYLLQDEAVKVWWDSHVGQFSDSVHAIVVSRKVRKNPEELLAAPNVVVVNNSFTFPFYRWTAGAA
jgi:hypothetical protein